MRLCAEEELTETADIKHNVEYLKETHYAYNHCCSALV